MFFFNLIILGASIPVVSARAIGDVAIRDSSSHSPPLQCAFYPHSHLAHELRQRPVSPEAYTNIPLHAWSHISSLLASHSSSMASGPPLVRNSVQTLRLAILTDDVTLENIVLGLVFTAADERYGVNELRSLPDAPEKMTEEVVGGSRTGKGDRDGEKKRCLGEAIKKVETERQVEGVLEMAGRGKMGYLVYRVD